MPSSNRPWRHKVLPTEMWKCASLPFFDTHHPEDRNQSQGNQNCRVATTLEKSSVQTRPPSAGSGFQAESLANCPRSSACRAMTTQMEVDLLGPTRSARSLHVRAASPASCASLPRIGLTIQVATGNVDRQQAVIGKSLQVNLQRLAGDQMDRHRIGAEDVEHQQVEFSRRPVNERKPCIPQDDFHLGAAIGKVGEVLRVAGDALDGRIDLVESDPLAGLAIGGNRPRPQPKHADVGQRPARLQGLEDSPQRSRTTVVGPRLVSLVRVKALATVARRAVHEVVRVPQGDVHHAQHAEETPLRVQQRSFSSG